MDASWLPAVLQLTRRFTELINQSRLWVLWNAGLKKSMIRLSTNTCVPRISGLYCSTRSMFVHQLTNHISIYWNLYKDSNPYKDNFCYFLFVTWVGIPWIICLHKSTVIQLIEPAIFSNMSQSRNWHFRSQSGKRLLELIFSVEEFKFYISKRLCCMDGWTNTMWKNELFPFDIFVVYWSASRWYRIVLVAAGSTHEFLRLGVSK